MFCSLLVVPELILHFLFWLIGTDDEKTDVSDIGAMITMPLSISIYFGEHLHLEHAFAFEFPFEIEFELLFSFDLFLNQTSLYTH